LTRGKLTNGEKPAKAGRGSKSKWIGGNQGTSSAIAADDKLWIGMKKNGERFVNRKRVLKNKNGNKRKGELVDNREKNRSDHSHKRGGRCGGGAVG